MQAHYQTAIPAVDEATQVLAGAWNDWQFETTDLSNMPSKALSIDTAEFFDPGIPAALPVNTPFRVASGIRGDDQITEEEFEQWLDALHGAGTAPSSVAKEEEATQLLLPNGHAPDEDPGKLAQVADIALELIGVRNDLRGLIGADAAPGLGQIEGRLDLLTRLLWKLASPAVEGTAGKRVEELLNVRHGDQIHALPVTAVIAVESLEPTRLTMLAGRRVLAHASGIIPVVERFPVPEDRSEGQLAARQKLVLINVRGSAHALIVDAVLGHEQALVKPLPEVLQQGPWCDGAVIRADGGVTLVLNPDAF